MRRNVTLSEFQRTEYLAVDIVQDNIAERTEAFGVRIIIPAETQQLGVLLGTPSEMTIRIIDDDRKFVFDDDCKGTSPQALLLVIPVL